MVTLIVVGFTYKMRYAFQVIVDRCADVLHIDPSPIYFYSHHIHIIILFRFCRLLLAPEDVVIGWHDECQTSNNNMKKRKKIESRNDDRRIRKLHKNPFLLPREKNPDESKGEEHDDEIMNQVLTFVNNSEKKGHLDNIVDSVVCPMSEGLIHK